MCYSGLCKYENYYGECDFNFDIEGLIPMDADCIEHEKEIDLYEYERLKNNLKYVIIEGLYKEKVIKNVNKKYYKRINHKNPKYKWDKEDIKLAVFNEIRNIMNDYGDLNE